MIKNFTAPEGEQPLYYSTTIVGGVVVQHDGDPQHAVYKSVLEEISRRANRWHAWVGATYLNAYDDLGIVHDEIFFANEEIRKQFMDGER